MNDNLNNQNNIEQKEVKGGKKKKKILKEIIEWIIYIAIFVLIVWGTPHALAKILDTQYPIATITSGSMWPVLKKGDIVLVKGVEGKEDIDKGDIVVYLQEKSDNTSIFVIHRVIRKKETTFITQGDANNREDAPVEYKNLIGKTVQLGSKPFRIPWLGKISQIFQK